MLSMVCSETAITPLNWSDVMREPVGRAHRNMHRTVDPRTSAAARQVQRNRRAAAQHAPQSELITRPEHTRGRHEINDPGF